MINGKKHTMNRIAFVLVAACAPVVAAQPITIRPLIVSGDPLPDGSVFTAHLGRAVIDGDQVAAMVATSMGDAIVRIDVVTGQIVMIASMATPSPTYPEFTMRGFWPPSIHGDTVVFAAASTRVPSGTNRIGVYASSGGEVSIVADEVGFPSLLPTETSTDGTSVIYKRAGAGDPIAITPLAGGGVVPFATRSMPAPDGGELFTIGRGVIRNGGGGLSALVSVVSPPYYAVYHVAPPSNALTTVTSSGQPMPGQPSRVFAGLMAHDAEADAVFFSGTDGGFPLNFDVACLYNSSGMHLIADDDTPMPGVPGRTFDAFSGSTDGGDVLLFGISQPDGPTPIYGAFWYRDGVLHPVLNSLESIDGLKVRDVGFLSQALDGDRAVLAVTLGSFERFGLYLAEFPGPCPADYNGDTAPDVLDFLDFLDDFGSCENQPAPCGSTANADFNGDTIVDVLDFLDFLDAFGIGCD